jgi:protein-disulfide isomerase
MEGLERWFLLRFISARLAVLSISCILAAAVGCKAQDAKSPGVKDPALARKIEVLVRSQFNVPPECLMTIGERKPISFAGYDSLQVTFARGPRTSVSDFLISSDNTTLARLEKFSLDKIPAQNIPVDHRPIRGNPAAKVTVINFDDLECPYCARMHEELFPRTLDRYKDKVRFIYKDDPLVEIHPWALHAAIDSNCIAEQNPNAYWGYVDYLHSHGQDVTGDRSDLKKSYAELDKIATEQGKIFALDATKLSACLEKQDDTAIRTSMKEAESLGVDGTPSLFIDGEHINGALPAEQVWIVIDRALRAAGVEPPATAPIGPSGPNNPPPTPLPVPAPSGK